MNIQDLVSTGVSLQQIIKLRHRGLCTGKPLESAYFEGDEDPRTRHLAALRYGKGEAKLFACVTLIWRPLGAEDAWFVCGLVTHEDFRRHGLGRYMLGYAELVVRNARPITPLLWCKARSQNIGFYEKHGWKRASKKIQEKDAETHVMMKKRLD